MLTVYKGPMFAGKTTKLVKLYKEKGGVVLKPAMDNRSGKGRILSHNKETLPAIEIRANCGIASFNKAADSEFVFLDEAQFFSNSNVEKLLFLSRMPGKHFYVFGLNKNWKGDPFSVMTCFEKEAEATHLLKGICHGCGKKESTEYTYKKNQNGKIFETGGEDLYEALCPECYKARCNEAGYG